MLNFYRLPQDYLKFEGADRLDLINRLSTNSVNSIDKNGAVKTILTSDKGRFVDLLHLFNFGDFIFSACSFRNAAAVSAHLDKYTIMDDFKVVDMSGTHGTFLLYGENVSGYLSKVTGCDLSGINEKTFTVVTHEGHDAVIVSNDNAFGGYHFIYSAEGKTNWEKLLLQYTTIVEYGISEMSEQEYNTHRILYGIPQFGNEMTGLTNPLECGMNNYVSFTKGCYIGQEVIARLDAYDKISKHMIGVKSEEALPLAVEPGKVKITLDGKECGFLTSSAHSDNHGNIGLGFIKTIFLDHSKDYKISFDDKIIDCRIVKLPFG